MWLPCHFWSFASEHARLEDVRRRVSYLLCVEIEDGVRDRMRVMTFRSVTDALVATIEAEQDFHCCFVVSILQPFSCVRGDYVDCWT